MQSVQTAMYSIERIIVESATPCLPDASMSVCSANSQDVSHSEDTACSSGKN